MPIKFRCCYCRSLLGISHRRAGAVVECPHCHGKVGVPVVDVPEDPPDLDEPSRIEEPEAPPLAHDPFTWPQLALTPALLGMLAGALLLLLALAFVFGLVIGRAGR
jgi:hypothetical protein